MKDTLITERRRFVADHYHSLPGFSEPRHGHDWELEATVKDGDTEALGRALDSWAAKIAHSLLNEQPRLAERNPTAESLAEWLFDFLESNGHHAVETKIREKENYWAICKLIDETVTNIIEKK